MNTPRYRRDFVTNPAFEEFLRILEEMRRKETENLKTASRSGELAKINTQVGIVDGIERVAARLQNFKKDTLQPAAQTEEDLAHAA